MILFSLLVVIVKITLTASTCDNTAAAANSPGKIVQDDAKLAAGTCTASGSSVDGTVCEIPCAASKFKSDYPPSNYKYYTVCSVSGTTWTKQYSKDAGVNKLPFPSDGSVKFTCGTACSPNTVDLPANTAYVISDCNTYVVGGSPCKLKCLDGFYKIDKYTSTEYTAECTSVGNDALGLKAGSDTLTSASNVCTKCVAYTATLLPLNTLLNSGSCDHTTALSSAGCVLKCSATNYVKPFEDAEAIYSLNCDATTGWIYKRQRKDTDSEPKNVAKEDLACYEKSTASADFEKIAAGGGGVCETPYPFCYDKGGRCVNGFCECYTGFKGDMCHIHYNSKTKKIVYEALSYVKQKGGGACDVQGVTEKDQCFNHGKCDETKRVCVCNFGWDNLHCQDRHKELWILVGSLLGSFFFIVLVVFLVWYCRTTDAQKKRQNLMKNMMMMRMMKNQRQAQPPQQRGYPPAMLGPPSPYPQSAPMGYYPPPQSYGGRM